MDVLLMRDFSRSSCCRPHIHYTVGLQEYMDTCRISLYRKTSESASIRQRNNIVPNKVFDTSDTFHTCNNYGCVVRDLVNQALIQVIYVNYAFINAFTITMM